MRGASVGLFLVLLLAAPAAAGTPEDVANDISANIMSPFCPGVTLHDCPSQSAIDLRERIEAWAADGFTRAQIMDRLVAEYGGSVRATPSGSEGLAAWVLPIAAALAGAGIAWWLVRGWVRTPVTPNDYDPAEHITPEDQRRLDRELRRFQEGT